MGVCYNRWIPWFSGWTEFTPAIPKMYWEVKSAEQRMHLVCSQLHKLVCFVDMLGDKISINRSDIEELQELFEKFMQSGFEDYYEEQILAWINSHMEALISESIKMVFFGLTDEGYFVAYIPDSWDEIVFDTGANFLLEDYGRLCLYWNVTNDDETVYQANTDILDALSYRSRIERIEQILNI